jgi:hypothetical protein
MNTVCALPGCPELVESSSVTSTHGYCDKHIGVGIIEAVEDLSGRIERLAAALERNTDE